MPKTNSRRARLEDLQKISDGDKPARSLVRGGKDPSEKESSPSPSRITAELLPAPVNPRKRPPAQYVRDEIRFCKDTDQEGNICNMPALPGDVRCRIHSKGQRVEGVVRREEGALFPYGQSVDVLHAYLETLEAEDREFVLSVYGDWCVDPEIALLRLNIRNLMAEGVPPGTQFQQLPKQVTALSNALREAIRMVEGNRLVVEFHRKEGQQYWLELFKAFSRFLEEGLASRLCPECYEVIQQFVSGGVANINQEEDIISDV